MLKSNFWHDFGAKSLEGGARRMRGWGLYREIPGGFPQESLPKGSYRAVEFFGNTTIERFCCKE